MHWLRREALAPRWETIRGWLVRFGPAEVMGVASAFVGSVVVSAITHNEISAAYGAAIGELLGFYGTIIGRDVVAEMRATPMDARGSITMFFVRSVRRVLRRAVVEFAPAEVLDASVLRPLAMGVCTSVFGRALGVTIGKVLSDVAFYAAVAIGDAMRRRRRERVAHGS